MTIREVLTRLDLQTHNTCTRQEKLNWLSELDGLVKARILDTHADPSPVQLPYTDPTADTTELLVPPPYDGLYIRWLEAKIHYQNGEFIRFNNAMELFQNGWRDFAAGYHRQHKSPGGTQFF